MTPLGRRGHMANEFLATYGWTASVAIIAVAIMFYFGVINPAALVPESCIFGQETMISCLGASASQEGSLNLLLENHGEARLLRSATCRYEQQQVVTTKSVSIDGRTLDGYPWGRDEFISFSCHFDGDNPFAGMAGTKRLIEVSLDLSTPDGKQLIVSAPVRVLVEG